MGVRRSYILIRGRNWGPGLGVRTQSVHVKHRRRKQLKIGFDEPNSLLDTTQSLRRRRVDFEIITGSGSDLNRRLILKLIIVESKKLRPFKVRLLKTVFTVFHKTWRSNLWQILPNCS